MYQYVNFYRIKILRTLKTCSHKYLNIMLNIEVHFSETANKIGNLCLSFTISESRWENSGIPLCP